MSRLRTIAAVSFLLLLVIGTAFVFVTRAVASNSSYSEDSLQCSQNYNTKVRSFQTIQSSCNVNVGEWIVLSLNSRFNLTVSVWLDAAGSSVPDQLLYNHTSTSFSTNIPLTTDGVAIAKLTNLQSNSSNLVVGTLQVFNQSSYIVARSTVMFPYRTIGFGLIGVSLVAMFFLAWRPKFIAQRPL